MKDAACVSLCTALISVCGALYLPAAVPVTMQSFAVIFALFLLGGKRGLAAVCVWVALGAFGAPVFSGFSGGAGVLFGMTGGYIMGFVLGAAAFFVLECFGASRGLCVVPVLPCAYLLGSLWIYIFYFDGTGLISLCTVSILPYLVPDVLKLAFAIYLAKRLAPILCINDVKGPKK